MSEPPGPGDRPRVLETAHGALRLPAFLPDATRAAVRCLDSGDVQRCGVQGLVAGAFHLMTHPGATVIAALGGLHEFMGWPGPILTDSGGFQVYSLLRGTPGLGTISRKGFRYRTAPGVSSRLLTPEKCVRVQFRLGADVVVCLDHCTHPGEPADEQRRSVEHTVAWAAVCRREFDRMAESTGRRPLLMAVVQGGTDAALRQECAERLVEMEFDGYGYGGWPIGPDGQLVETVAQVAGLVPDGAFRWALGIGRPEHVVSAVRMGYDLLDCVLPTRDARHGRLYVFRDRPEVSDLRGDGFYERLYPMDDRHVRDRSPVGVHCDCACCAGYSRAYLCHLFRVRDPLAWRLATVHNLRFYMRLMERLRSEVHAG